MKEAWRAVWTLLWQLFLALTSQPVPGPSQAERKAREARGEGEPASALAALRTLAREALLALTLQPSPGPRSSASRRKPRS